MARHLAIVIETRHAAHISAGSPHNPSFLLLSPSLIVLPHTSQHHPSMTTSETSAMATGNPEQTSLSSVWRPEVEDDVDSIDENPDDRDAWPGALPRSSQR